MTKTHRVGTITLGGMLITFGTLFLLRIFVTTISYHIIFKLWPIIFILLGIEVLLSFFAMGMSIAEFAMTQINYELINHINY
ncbi:MAG: hypothetical protein K0R00_3414 [Herbinix sp.]|nr:hypothetical protein [Herbinix sp.]